MMPALTAFRPITQRDRALLPPQFHENTPATHFPFGCDLASRCAPVAAMEPRRG